MSNKSNNNVPSVDLTIVIDTSPSMKDEAQALSRAAEAAIDAAKSSCPSNLRVTWLGIEGIWKGTKFDRTIRAYLTQECKISESSLKGRKRGELKSAGAQEDAARAIEDISDYFDWREGAARAIFYLGDEALEGGGSKTEQKDIQAANLAIQKAKQAGVTIHSYFGTSKSKHREGTAAEYRRIATETGGQAFTNKDALKGFTSVLEKVICGSRTDNTKTYKLMPGTVYIQNCQEGEVSSLYTLDLTTGKASLVGAITTDIYDLAFVGNQLYGLDQEKDSKTTKLVKIDPANGSSTLVGDIGFYVVGLAYNRQDNTLYASAAKQLIAIDSETGQGKPALTVSKDERGCGEVAFKGDGQAYITLIGTDRKKLLASCDLDSNQVTIIGDIGFPDLASMEFVGDVLYGVTGNFFDLGKDGQLIRIDTTTGKGTLVTTTDPLGRWAGMTLYEPATAITSKTPAQVNSDQQSETTIEEEMKLLTIDTKDNCYVINPESMNELQQNVASTYTFESGNYELQISGGSYRYGDSDSEVEPSILLWIYGVDGSSFINKNTGFETGATWTTLNGYNDRLQLEVKQQAVVCALLFDTKTRERHGSISLSITSDRESFTSQQLTIDSNNNCYLLDEKYLTNLKQWDSNFIELEPGNYKIKIREGNASYWSENQKFELEPWALIWLKAGKFVSKLTGLEVEETWCSLNGLQDEFILEVKEKTTLAGFFFDTYKEDNEGQIILAIEPITATELAEAYQQQQNINFGQQVATTFSSTTTATSVSTSSSSQTTVGVTAASGGTTSIGQGQVSPGTSFSFHFNEAQMEQMWQQMAAKIETSIAVTDEQDEKKEARYWDSLEKWILKGYQTQARELAMTVARMEFMMKTMTQQMEVSFNQNFQAWSVHFNNRINDLISTRITTIVNDQVNLKIADQTQNITNQVVQQLKANIDNSIDTIVNQKITNLSANLSQEIENKVAVDIEKKITNAVNVNIENRSTEINTQVIEQIKSEMDHRIENIVDLKVANLNQQITQIVLERLDQRIDAVVNLKVQNLLLQVQQIHDSISNLRQEITQIVLERLDEKIDAVVNVKIQDLILQVQQLQGSIDNRIDVVVNSKILDLTQTIKNQIIEQIKPDIDRQINVVVDQSTGDNIDLVFNNVREEVNNLIDVNFDNKILNFRNNELALIIQNELNQNFTDSITATVINSIKHQQFFLDIKQAIETDINNFYARLGQFQTQLYLKIEQGDTQLYNWTLQQLQALQGCLTDRQALVEMFESFASKLKDELDSAPCVQPSRFTAWVTTETNPQLEPVQPGQLPGS